MKHGGRILAALLSLLAVRGAAAAELAWSVRWKSIEVEARLDAQGDLRVEEREALVLDGDWTEVERRFALPAGATLQIEAVEPLGTGAHPASSPAAPAWTQDGALLRWTIRPPDAPALQDAEVGVLIRYRISGLLQKAGGGGYRLAYDFAPQGRRGVADVVRARLALDPAWRAGDGPLTLERRDLLSGQSALLMVGLRWEGSGAGPGNAPGPAGEARQPFPSDLRGPLLTLLVFLLVLGAGLLWWYDFGRGLFNPLPPPDSIDEAWLRENVLSLPPEVVGAAWDGRLGAPEVAAMLAQLVLSGMLEVRARPGATGPDAHVLRLLVDRSELGTPERALADAVFVHGAEIDARALRRHHGWRDVGPATAIAAGVQALAAQLLPPGRGRSLWPWLLGGLLVAAGVLVGVSAAARGEALLPIAATFAAGLVLLGAGLVTARALAAAMFPVSRRVALFAAAAAPLVLGIGAIAWLVSDGVATDGGGVLSATLLWAGGLALVAGTARTHLSPDAMARLRGIEAARLFFASELRAELPRLRDPWIPCLVALGLAREIDRWAAAHPRAAEGAAAAHVLGAHTFTGGAAHVAAASWSALVRLTASRPWSTA